MKSHFRVPNVVAVVTLLVLNTHIPLAVGAQERATPASQQGHPIALGDTELPAWALPMTSPGPNGEEAPVHLLDPSRFNAMVLLKRMEVRRELKLTTKQQNALDNLMASARKEIKKAQEAARSPQGGVSRRNPMPGPPNPGQPQTAEAGNPPSPPASPPVPPGPRTPLVQQQEQARQALQDYLDNLDRQAWDVLQPEQQQRLRELDLQWRGPMALSDPNVAQAFNLAPDQTQGITGNAREFRAAQIKAIKDGFPELAAERHPQTLRPNMPGAGGRFRPGGARGRRGTASAPPNATASDAMPQIDMTNPDILARFDAINRDIEKARKAADKKTLSQLSSEQQDQFRLLQGRKFTFYGR